MNRSLYKLAALIALAAIAQVAHGLASFANIPGGLWSTGRAPVPVVLVPYSGGTLDAQIDAHYALIKLPAGCAGPACQQGNDPTATFGPAAYVVLGPNGQYPLTDDAWLVRDTAASSWIAPRADQRDPIVGDYRYDHAEIFGADDDFYVYRTTFDLTALGLDPATAQVQLSWVSDDAANGAQTAFSHIRMCAIATPADSVCPSGAAVLGSTNAGQFSTALTPVAITSGFASGLMALDFIVYNQQIPSGHNASGVNVSIDSATAAPLPAISVVLAGGGSGTVASDVAGISCPADCSHGYLPGTQVTLTATPADGSSAFTGWLGGDCHGASPTCTITVTADVGIRATFGIGGTAATLDVDGSAPSTRYDALTDGLLILRYLFGLTGPSLVANAVTPGAARATPDAVASYLADILPALDVDGNGQVDALTDGLIIIRKLFGVAADAMTAGALGSGATRTPAQIDAYLQTLMP